MLREHQILRHCLASFQITTEMSEVGFEPMLFMTDWRATVSILQLHIIWRQSLQIHYIIGISETNPPSPQQTATSYWKRLNTLCESAERQCLHVPWIKWTFQNADLSSRKLEKTNIFRQCYTDETNTVVGLASILKSPQLMLKPNHLCFLHGVQPEGPQPGPELGHLKME